MDARDRHKRQTNERTDGRTRLFVRLSVRPSARLLDGVWHLYSTLSCPCITAHSKLSPRTLPI